MELNRNQYYRFLVFFMTFVCAFCSFIFLWAIRSTEEVHATQTYEQIYAIKKVFLKNTV